MPRVGSVDQFVDCTDILVLAPLTRAGAAGLFGIPI